MERFTEMEVQGFRLRVYRHEALVIGAGAAGFSALCRLKEMGVDCGLFAEGLRMGTSRNTGSDKQTYYRVNDAQGDSALDMAQTLFAGGAMHGDVALAEAGMSARCFYRLVELGVAFPHDAYGRYIGYQTDHDAHKRATSLGPLTSRAMTEALEARARMLGAALYDQRQLAALLRRGNAVVGALALDTSRLGETGAAGAFDLFLAPAIVAATGGPAGLYEASVYPASQTGALGVALEAGAAAVNLTESQFGLASTGFRWNLSGSYQQVLPQYVSVDAAGNEHDFLQAAFGTLQDRWLAIFQKGYQWPFDARKAFGSSRIDLAVEQERRLGRRVYLDYAVNPGGAAFSVEALPGEAREYLRRSGAMAGTPIERLRRMNAPAVELYRAQGIELGKERLPIAVCAQHMNGGLGVDARWRSNVAGLYPVGEACGTHGVYRPGGAALNAGQVGALRAAMEIAGRRRAVPEEADAREAVEDALARVRRALGDGEMGVGGLHGGGDGEMDGGGVARGGDTAGGRVRPAEMLARLRRCSAAIGFVRSREDAAAALRENEAERAAMEAGGVDAEALPAFLHVRDHLMAQGAVLSAIVDAIDRGVRSRGSVLVHDAAGTLPGGCMEAFRFALDDGSHQGVVQETRWNGTGFAHTWVKVRPLPQPEDWFEAMWAEYRAGRRRGEANGRTDYAGNAKSTRSTQENQSIQSATPNPQKPKITKRKEHPKNERTNP